MDYKLVKMVVDNSMSKVFKMELNCSVDCLKKSASGIITAVEKHSTINGVYFDGKYEEDARTIANREMGMGTATSCPYEYLDKHFKYHRGLNMHYLNYFVKTDAQYGDKWYTVHFADGRTEKVADIYSDSRFASYLKAKPKESVYYAPLRCVKVCNIVSLVER